MGSVILIDSVNGIWWKVQWNFDINW